MPDLNILLAIHGKLRPIGDYLLLGADESSIDENERCQAGDGLGEREDIDNGVFIPDASTTFVKVATPDVDYVLTVYIDHD